MDLQGIQMNFLYKFLTGFVKLIVLFNIHAFLKYKIK